MNERVKYCDAIRFVSVLLVIAIHCFYLIRLEYISKNTTYYLFNTLLDSFTRGAVPAFFMLTGAFLLNSNKYQSCKEFYKKKIPILFISLLFISLIYYLFDCFYFKTTLFSLKFFIRLFFGEYIKYNFWYMYSIIIIYLFIPFLRKMIDCIKQKEILLLIIIIFILGNCFNTINSFASQYYTLSFGSFTLPNLFIYINYLFLGYYLYNYNLDKKHQKIFIFIGFLCPFINTFFNYLQVKDNKLMNDFMLNCYSIFPFFQGIMLFIVFKYNYNKMKILKKFEKIFLRKDYLFLYVYLINSLVIFVLDKELKKIFIINSFFKSTLYFIFIFFTATILSFLIAKIILRFYTILAKKLKHS